MAGADVRNAGNAELATLRGVSPQSPLVSARAKTGLPYDVDSRFSTIQTTDGIAQGPASMPDVRLLDDWRDALNPQSPAFWLLLFMLAILGFMQFRLQLGGRKGARVGLG